MFHVKAAYRNVSFGSESSRVVLCVSVCACVR